MLYTGAPQPTLGNYLTISNPPSGKNIKKHRQYLNKVHMDIVFGNYLSLGGLQYALVLVDVATRYCWIYSLQSLTSPHIIAALKEFCANAGGLPAKFHSDFGHKLVGGLAL